MLLFLDGKNMGQINIDRENDDSLWKRNFEKRILCVLKLNKIGLNLIR